MPRMLPARFLVAALVLLVLFVSGCASAPWGASADKPRNIIILFGDGAAAMQWEFGRYTSEALRQRPFVTTDVVFRRGTLGLLSTDSLDSAVTDSAAAATAMATGVKARTGAISVGVDGKPLKTVFEIAKEQRKRIGLVTTAAVHDASPAAFAAHVRSRRESQSIVDQYFAFEPDVIIGGGRDYFLPKEKSGGRRGDGKDMVAAFAAKGYQVVTDPQALRSARGPRLLALFADDDMEHEIDRDPKVEPSNAEMAEAALRVLSANSPDGFVLFIENENIDTAAHRNDAAALMRDLWAFDDAVRVAVEYRERFPETLVIITGDHETGGLSWSYAQRALTATSRDRFYPVIDQLRLLEGIRASHEKTALQIGRKPTAEAVDKVVAANYPGFQLDPDLRAALVNNQVLERNMFYMPHAVFGRMVSRPTGIYWGTSGHTTEPVVVGAIGPGAAAFSGYMPNTEFAKVLMRLLTR